MKTHADLSQFAWRTAPLIWGLAAAWVWVWTTRYEFSAYRDDNAESVLCWPEETRLNLAGDRPTLLFFMHPRCPCTRASVRELERILTGVGISETQQPKCVVVASLPSDASDEWRDSDTLRRASGLPFAEIAWDVGGVESKRFGAATSGAVRLFHPDGKLLFAGGVTASRGHEGDNVGSDRLFALLGRQEHDRQEATPVFGCRLCIEAVTPARDEMCEARQPTDGLVFKGVAQ